MAHGATPTVLADRLVAFVVETVEAFVRHQAPGLVLPRALGGFPIDQDTRADIAYTLGLLHAAGVREIGGGSVEDAIRRTMTTIHGPRTNPFSAYRVAETIRRFGLFEPANPLLAPLDERERANLAAACDASDWIAYLDAGLPANYAVVLARGEHQRAALGLRIDAGVFDDLLARTRALFATEVPGWLDDSGGRDHRFDIYSADAHLFALPLADALGPTWTTGCRAVLDAVEHLGATNGAAFVWGRSTGLLSICMTIELGALGLAHGWPANPGRWQARIGEAAAGLPGWFDEGLTSAHRHRSPYGYRGPARRVQLTFDVLGKLVAAALDLRAASTASPTATTPAPRTTVHPHRDELVACTTSGTAGVWSFRSEQLAFVLPLVGGLRSDYLPAPQNPGLFEVPVDSPLAAGVPTLWRGSRRYVPAGAPAAARHERGTLHTVHDGFHETSDSFDQPAPSTLPGTRRATYHVEGRTLHVDEILELPGPVPHAVTLAVTETEHRPLRLDVTADHAHTTRTVLVEGVKDYRSFWGVLARSHEVDLEPAPRVAFRWSVTPLLRVMSTAHGHQYDEELYRGLDRHVARRRVPLRHLGDRAGLAAALTHVDQFHLHWPEWLTGVDLARARAVIDALDDAEVRVVWTMHNLKAHAMDGSEALYELWAPAADLVLHHSAWGRDLALATYDFRPDARHVVVPHLHWGDALARIGVPAREAAEATLGLGSPGPDAIRVGIVGAPRSEKDVQLVLDAMADCTRADLRLVVFGTEGETVPDDPRIVAMPYDYVSPAEYATQLATLDALVLPFAPHGMLTTGTVGDALGLGLPCLVSDWPYLHEILGDAGIRYGSTADDLRACLDGLDRDQLDHAAAAAADLRDRFSPSRIRAQFLAELDRLGTAKL